jgi:hypothetical protein
MMQGARPGPKAKPCDEIIEKLFLGTKACAENPGELADRSIELTIGVGRGLELEEREVFVFWTRTPILCQISCSDWPSISSLSLF